MPAQAAAEVVSAIPTNATSSVHLGAAAATARSAAATAIRSGVVAEQMFTQCSDAVERGEEARDLLLQALAQEEAFSAHAAAAVTAASAFRKVYHDEQAAAAAVNEQRRLAMEAERAELQRRAAAFVASEESKRTAAEAAHKALMEKKTAAEESAATAAAVAAAAEEELQRQTRAQAAAQGAAVMAAAAATAAAAELRRVTAVAERKPLWSHRDPPGTARSDSSNDDRDRKSRPQSGRSTDAIDLSLLTPKRVGFLGDAALPPLGPSVVASSERPRQQRRSPIPQQEVGGNSPHISTDKAGFSAKAGIASPPSASRRDLKQQLQLPLQNVKPPPPDSRDSSTPTFQTPPQSSNRATPPLPGHTTPPQQQVNHATPPQAQQQNHAALQEAQSAAARTAATVEMQKLQQAQAEQHVAGERALAVLDARLAAIKHVYDCLDLSRLPSSAVLRIQNEAARTFNASPRLAIPEVRAAAIKAVQVSGLCPTFCL